MSEFTTNIENFLNIDEQIICLFLLQENKITNF